MFLLNPIRQEKVWGFEDWMASTFYSCVQENLSSVSKNFPLLVKTIKADSFLSVQVHPDDKTASVLETADSRGKTECWYVLDAAENSKIVLGLAEKVTQTQLEKAVKENKIENLLNYVSVKKGDFIYIPAGTIHALGGGIKVLEVQQSCDTTYRFYDWGRPRPVHLEKALKSIKLDFSPQITTLQEFTCPYFSLKRQKISGGYSYFISKTQNYPELLYIEEGTNLSVTFTDKNSLRKENVYLYPGELYVTEAGEKITVEGKGHIIRIKAF